MNPHKKEDKTVNDDQADNPFPDEAGVMVRYPAPGMTASDPREDWPWMPGVIENRCGPGEWLVTVYARELAQLADGTPAPDGTSGEDMWFPQCFRNASELSPQAAEQARRAG